MATKVIQGFFLGGRSRVLASPIQPKPSTSRVGPRVAAFAPLSPVAQRLGNNDSFQVDPARLGLSSGGRPLPETIRGGMEAAFGADFSAVRIHVGPQAERIGALAFTTGTDIYFAPGRYQPETVQGRRLLGHELAHVVQQRQGRVRTPIHAGLAVVQDRALEAEAERLGQRAATHADPLQAKPTHAAAPVRISEPMRTGPNSHRLLANHGGRPIGSVMVHMRDRQSVEVTNLGVEAAHRNRDIGKQLLVSAAGAARRFGREKLALAAQDNGSGRLTRWYKDLGFSTVGINERGFPKMEALTERLLRSAPVPPLQSIQGFSRGGSAQAKLQQTPSRLARFPDCPCHCDNAGTPVRSITGGLEQARAWRAIPTRVVQRMEWEGYPDTPPATPTVPDSSVWAEGLEYHIRNDSEEFIQQNWEEKFNKHHNKTIGQSYGTKESEDFDASYVEGTGCRPAATNVKSLWNTVYNSATQSTLSGYDSILCAELCRLPVYIHSKNKTEYNTMKRPPMCHIVPYNHIKWAIEHLNQNQADPRINKLIKKAKYIGGPATNLPLQHWQAVVWQSNNLRAGHAHCNSLTASQAKGNPPTTREEDAAIEYTIKQLNTVNGGNYFK